MSPVSWQSEARQDGRIWHFHPVEEYFKESVTRALLGATCTETLIATSPSYVGSHVSVRIFTDWPWLSISPQLSFSNTLGETECMIKAGLCVSDSNGTRRKQVFMLGVFAKYTITCFQVLLVVMKSFHKIFKCQYHTSNACVRKCLICVLCKYNMGQHGEDRIGLSLFSGRCLWMSGSVCLSS